MPSSLLETLRTKLAAAGEPARAAHMQGYMKSEMPYHGVPAASMQTLFREIFADLTFPDRATWEREVLNLWTQARFREERYAAVALAGHRRARVWQTPAALPVYERIILEAAWWDIVDDIAMHRIRPILVRFPDDVKPLIRLWARDPNLWKQRTAIICQCGLKGDTDFDLLRDCIEPALGSREFFLRKAIGWALREYSRARPDEVLDYVTLRAEKLSPLSKREALRLLRAGGRIEAIL